MNIANTLEGVRENLSKANQALTELKDASEQKADSLKATLRKWLE